MNSSSKKVLLIVVSAAVLAAAALVGWQLTKPTRGKLGFAADHEWLDGIVAETDRQLQVADTLVTFRLHALADPLSLKPIGADDKPERGKMAGWVWAMRQDGILEVWIESLDNGHAGEFGYVYLAEGDRPGWDADRFGERWEVDEQMTAHWWAISYRLD